MGELHFWASSYSILSTTGAQQGGPLLFSLVLLDYLSAHPPLDGQLYQLWYLDDGALIGSWAILASFLNVLQHDGHSFLEFPSSVKRMTFSDTGGPLCFWSLNFGFLMPLSH